jgi:hypothetical protein
MLIEQKQGSILEEEKKCNEVFAFKLLFVNSLPTQRRQRREKIKQFIFPQFFAQSETGS